MLYTQAQFKTPAGIYESTEFGRDGLGTDGAVLSGILIWRCPTIQYAER